MKVQFYSSYSLFQNSVFNKNNTTPKRLTYNFILTINHSNVLLEIVIVKKNSHKKVKIHISDPDNVLDLKTKKEIEKICF
ncbi:MAG: hypothetical protein KatS3mg129_3124 [Leptospiraceae bacterium]|nr:MAG: hypothetical protein KatS3mg129_3124 [Leptospiraceae bacterium]